MASFYWKRHPDGPFARLIAVTTTYLHPESDDPGSLKALARRGGDQEMRVFKSELREALRDPGRLPGGELRKSVQYDNGSDEAFLRWLWYELYGEPFEADIITRLMALPEPFAERLPGMASFDVRDAARAGEWAEALDVLLAALINASVPVSAAERDELAALLKAAGQPLGAVSRLSVSQPGAPGQHRYGDDSGADA